MTGTKFGCGIAQCGACTVHADGVPLRSCITPVEAIVGRQRAPVSVPHAQFVSAFTVWKDAGAPCPAG